MANDDDQSYAKPTFSHVSPFWESRFELGEPYFSHAYLVYNDLLATL